MDLPQEIEDYIKQSIEHSFGLPISTNTLQSKLRASEEAQRRLREQYLVLLSKLKEKDQILDRAKTEACMNAQAVKKFVEANQKLAAECADLLSQREKLERECSLYDHDREALMDFGNEADERAKEAERRVHNLEEDIRKLSKELQFYKRENETSKVDSTSVATSMEENLLVSILGSLTSKTEVTSGRAFLEANCKVEPCQKLLQEWDSLRPLTQKVLSLVSELKTLEKDKEHLRRNLHKAEEEVELLFKENKLLDEENCKLTRQHRKELTLHGSGGSESTKTNKRKSSPQSNKRKTSPQTNNNSPVEKKIDFRDVDSARKPLSPLQYNSPDSRIHK